MFDWIFDFDTTWKVLKVELIGGFREDNGDLLEECQLQVPLGLPREPTHLVLLMLKLSENH